MKLNKLTLIITLLLAFTSSLVASNYDAIEKHKKLISLKFNFNPNRNLDLSEYTGWKIEDYHIWNDSPNPKGILVLSKSGKDKCHACGAKMSVVSFEYNKSKWNIVNSTKDMGDYGEWGEFDYDIVFERISDKSYGFYLISSSLHGGYSEGRIHLIGLKNSKFQYLGWIDNMFFNGNDEKDISNYDSTIHIKKSNREFYDVEVNKKFINGKRIKSIFHFKNGKYSLVKNIKQGH